MMRLLCLLALVLFSCLSVVKGAPAPHVIIILADDFGWGDVSVQGGTVSTPELDRMAGEGSRFTQFYVASPICSPSRAGIITGRHPGRSRITSYLQTRKGNAACGQADYLDSKAPSLPRELKAAGYATAHIGKWHLGGGRDVDDAPKFAAYGYDLGIGTYESPEPHPDLTATNWIWSPQDKVKRWDRTRWMVDRTLDFLKEHPDKPAFVNLWLDDTHTPWIPEEGTELKRESAAALKGVLVEMDRQIGRLLEALRQRKDGERDTLVLFFGDNGALPTFQQDRVGGLRGSKLSLHEGGIRVPFIAWWPGKVPAGRVDETSVVSSLDLLPTLRTLAAAQSEAPADLDGQDVSAAWLGGTVQRSAPLFWEYGRNNESFKFPGPKNRSPNLAVREGQWKLLVQEDGSDVQLYNLAQDRNEASNVATQHPEVTKRLTDLVLNWRKTLP